MVDRSHEPGSEHVVEHHPGETASAAGGRIIDWDQRYLDADQVWSGRPNTALIAEASGLGPGRALDVGCGEGADAIWLAQQGWEVTALDVSQVAIHRAQAAARSAGVAVTWVHAGLLDASIVAGAFDLVSAQYPALLRTPDRAAERALLDAVAPGGHLLVVHHVLTDADIDRARSHGFDPTLYVSPDDVAAMLDPRWEVTFDRYRPRHVGGGAGAHHTADVVLHARQAPS